MIVLNSFLVGKNFAQRYDLFLNAFVLGWLFLPFGHGDIAELYILALALQANVALFHLVCAGVLVNAIDIDGNHAVLHEDICLVPFASRFLGRLMCFLDYRELGARTGELRQV